MDWNSGSSSRSLDRDETPEAVSGFVVELSISRWSRKRNLDVDDVEEFSMDAKLSSRECNLQRRRIVRLDS